jgi:ribose/xylose/arabinose/galactoside ABC-type transport system permease subunit
MIVDRRQTDARLLSEVAEADRVVTSRREQRLGALRKCVTRCTIFSGVALSRIGDMAEATDLERAPAIARTSARRTPRVLPGVEIQILIAIAILATTFSIAFPDSFATSGTLLNVARVSSIMLVVAIGQAFALIVGGFDISVGSTMGLVSITVALLMKTGMDVPLAAVLATLVGTTVGLINGIGIALFRITPFVMTLGILTAARGLADELANGRVITGFPHVFAMYGRAMWGPIPSATCIALVVLVISRIILQRIRVGLYIFAIGGSRETTCVAGIPVALYEMIAYALCGTMAGIGGVMLTSRVGVAQGSLRQGYELLSVATAVIGGVLIGGGVGRLTGVVLGVILITVLNTGLDIAGVNPFLQQIVTGLVLILAVLLSQARTVSIRKVLRGLSLRRPE